MARRNGVLVSVYLVVLLSFAATAGPIDAFLQQFQTGNLHTLLNAHPVDAIVLFGREPDSYEYYASDARIFAYVDTDVKQGISAIALIWLGDEIQQVRVTFVGKVSPEEAIVTLGYSLNFFDAPVSGTRTFGKIPYYTRTYSKPDIFPYSIGSAYMLDLDFMFLLDHFSEDAHILIIRTS
jgi:hypothetical protein